MDFYSLWERSRTFKAVFRANGVTNADRAHRLWYKRDPKLEWRICGVDGCTKIATESDRFCMDHIVPKMKRLPEWLFISGRLFRYTPIRFGHARELGGRDYRDYAETVCEKTYGPRQVGYSVHFIDGNVFNCDSPNLVPLSHIAQIAVIASRLSVDTALEIDSRIDDIITGRKNRPRSAAIIGYGHIAKAVGLTQSAVRTASSRGEFSLADSDSVIAYILKKNELERRR